MSNNRFLDLDGLTKYTDLVKNHIDVKIDEVSDTLNASIETKVDKETFENRFEYLHHESLLPEDRTPWTVYLIGSESEKLYLTIEALEDNFQIEFYNECNALYSLNDGQWTPFGDDYISPVMNVGDKLYIKGELEPGNYMGNFYTEQSFNLLGNCNSIIFGDDAISHNDLTDYNDCYNGLFSGCEGLKNVSPNFLPATTLAEYCYSNMFDGCTSLVAAPELPATTLAEGCYQNMLSSCDSLITAPELPATTLAEYCYSNMFAYCTSLVAAPELPSTTLASECYSYMFDGCTTLVTTPELPATTLASGCYANMFSNCTSLVTTPELPATELVDRCYSYMFYGCASLVNAPELPATELVDNCYSYMFYGCILLNYIKALFTTEPGSDYTSCWVEGVSSTGTFVKNADATWDVTGVDGIPEEWTVQTA